MTEHPVDEAKAQAYADEIAQSIFELDWPSEVKREVAVWTVVRGEFDRSPKKILDIYHRVHAILAQKGEPAFETPPAGLPSIEGYVSEEKSKRSGIGTKLGDLLPLFSADGNENEHLLLRKASKIKNDSMDWEREYASYLALRKHTQDQHPEIALSSAPIPRRFYLDALAIEKNPYDIKSYAASLIAHDFFLDDETTQEFYREDSNTVLLQPLSRRMCRRLIRSVMQWKEPDESHPEQFLDLCQAVYRDVLILMPELSPVIAKPELDDVLECSLRKKGTGWYDKIEQQRDDDTPGFMR